MRRENGTNYLRRSERPPGSRSSARITNLVNRGRCGQTGKTLHNIVELPELRSEVPKLTRSGRVRCKVLGWPADHSLRFFSLRKRNYCTVTMIHALRGSIPPLHFTNEGLQGRNRFAEPPILKDAGRKPSSKCGRSEFRYPVTDDAGRPCEPSCRHDVRD